MFIGRQGELRELRSRYATERPETILVSGKRRIGKSQLIVESMRDFDGLVISYECFKSTYRQNVQRMEEEIKKVFGNAYLHFDTLYDLILFLHENAASRKILFVLDEYPYMREGDATDSEIKNALDRIEGFDKKNPLKIIICGSSVDVMDVLDEQNKPLYGRFTSKIQLGPLDYYDSAMFYPHASNEDKVNYYCVLGGVPYFLKQIDDRLSFDENIVRLFFSATPFLRTELESQINHEIGKIENGPFILGIIRNRTISYTDILQTYNASRPDKSVDYALKCLKEIGAIEKRTIRQDNGKTKLYYAIRDTAITFFYTFLNISLGNPLLYDDREYYEVFIKEGLMHDFIPHMFERVGFEFLARMNRRGLLPVRLLDLYPYVINDRIGKQSYQFDIVGETRNGLINYECKYQDVPISPSSVRLENRQAALVKDHFIRTVFISKSKVLDDKVESYGLDDLFDERLKEPNRLAE